MSIKNTKRKGFNFFRSYWDVYNELENDKDRLAFIDALLNKQFLGINPDNLKGLAKFAWISQQHSIDTQVKGYEDKTGNKLSDTQACTPPTEGGRQGGAEGGSDTPALQVEGKGKGKVEYTNSLENNFLNLFNKLKKERGGRSAIKTLSKTDKNNLKQLRKNYEREDFIVAINNMLDSKWPAENNQQVPSHILRVDNFNKYLNMEGKKELTLAEKLAGKQ